MILMPRGNHFLLRTSRICKGKGPIKYIPNIILVYYSLLDSTGVNKKPLKYGYDMYDIFRRLIDSVAIYGTFPCSFPALSILFILGKYIKLRIFNQFY